MEKKNTKPLCNTYIFEIEIKEVQREETTSVEILERTYFVDRIGAERLLISSYPYGSDSRIDAELDACREALDDLLASARELGVCATRIGMHKVAIDGLHADNELITAYLRGFTHLRHFRVKNNRAVNFAAKIFSACRLDAETEK